MAEKKEQELKAVLTEDLKEELENVTVNLKKIYSRLSESFDSMNNFKNQIKDDEDAAPLVEALQEIQIFRERLDEAFFPVVELSQSLRIADMMGQEEYVYFDRIKLNLSENILQSDNIEEALRLYIEEDAYMHADKIIQGCKKELQIDKYKGNVFKQAVSAYENEEYDLAVIGFIAMVDGLLSDVSKDQATTQIGRRAKKILDKLEKKSPIVSDEYAYLTMLVSFEKAFYVLQLYSDFEKEEPDNLNRHWIMHGRSTRKKTKLDCIKVIRMIYGILFIKKIEKEDGKSFSD
ncbi:MAG: hypothetical protein MRZ93_05775 [Lachnospiraceae bacterium]|nr:hypothetical protein [Lachnospiraceae bacterium]